MKLESLLSIVLIFHTPKLQQKAFHPSIHHRPFFDSRGGNLKIYDFISTETKPFIAIVFMMFFFVKLNEWKSFPRKVLLATTQRALGDSPVDRDEVSIRLMISGVLFGFTRAT